MAKLLWLIPLAVIMFSLIWAFTVAVWMLGAIIGTIATFGLIILAVGSAIYFATRWLYRKLFTKRAK